MARAENGVHAAASLPCSDDGRDEQGHREAVEDQSVHRLARPLRGDPRVAPETTARLRDGARDGLHAEPGRAEPDHLKTGTVALIVSDITNPFYPGKPSTSCTNEFALGGYRTVLFNERTDALLEQHVSDLVNGAAVDGLVYVSKVSRHAAPGRGVRAVPSSW